MKENLVYYSLVGSRAIPVCMPIYYLMKEDYHLNAKVTLIYTPEVKQVSERAERFLRKEFKDRIKIYAKEYYEFKNNLIKGNIENNAEINLTPGMSWQVAEIVLNLPKHIKCINIDYRYIYRYPLSTGIDSAVVEKIKRNLTIDNYMFLNPEIKIKKTNEPHRFVKMYNLKSQNGYKILFKNNKYIDWLNYSLVGLQEIGGFLYLLFDLTKAGIHPDLKAKKDYSNYRLLLYRIITSKLNPLNYGITVITDSEHLLDKANLDGFSAIKEDAKSIKEWFKNPPDPKKQKIPTESYRLSIKPKLKGDSILFICIGDNIVSTLKAIKAHREAHKIDTVVAFYDDKSERIKSITKLLEKKMALYASIIKQPTDHMGRGIVEKVKQIVKDKEADFYFNITPGTKSQTVALVTASDQTNLKNRVFSIKKDNLVSIIDNKVVGITSEISPDEVISFYCPDHDFIEKEIIGNLKENAKLWDNLLEGFANDKLEYTGNGLFGIQMTNSKKKLLKIKDFNVFHNIYKETYQLPKDIFNSREKSEGGWWWEILTFWAILRHRISSKVILNVICLKSKRHKNDNKNQENKYSEIDVVFSYKGNIVVVSCKTALKEIDLDSFQLLSESRQRFGRMAINFIAVPYNRNIKTINEEVCVLTPKQLYNRNRLIESIENHVKNLSTTT